MAPEFFGTIAKNLKSEGVTATNGWSRLVIEKPFGHDLPSAKALNEEIREAFTEDQIYRIDHYLGKQMVQNIEVIRFANAIFEPLWTNRYISNIQITSSESLRCRRPCKLLRIIRCPSRHGAKPYSSNGGTACNGTANQINTEEIRSEKVKVLRALRSISKDEVDEYFVRGQYRHRCT